ncbi:MAG: hypothetical protein KBC64_01400 [Simkaniaceae bacterium]|nr:hypothetical protein [Simkaniaceae bacterium]
MINIFTKESLNQFLKRSNESLPESARISVILQGLDDATGACSVQTVSFSMMIDALVKERYRIYFSVMEDTDIAGAISRLPLKGQVSCLIINSHGDVDSIEFNRKKGGVLYSRDVPRLGIIPLLEKRATLCFLSCYALKTIIPAFQSELPFATILGANSVAGEYIFHPEIPALYLNEETDAKKWEWRVSPSHLSIPSREIQEHPASLLAISLSNARHDPRARLVVEYFAERGEIYALEALTHLTDSVLKKIECRERAFVGGLSSCGLAKTWKKQGNLEKAKFYLTDTLRRGDFEGYCMLAQKGLKLSIDELYKLAIEEGCPYGSVYYLQEIAEIPSIPSDPRIIAELFIRITELKLIFAPEILIKILMKIGNLQPYMERISAACERAEDLESVNKICLAFQVLSLGSKIERNRFLEGKKECQLTMDTAKFLGIIR